MIIKSIHFMLCVIIIFLVGISGGCDQLSLDTRGSLPDIQQPLTTHIYYDNGELLSRHFSENRIEVSLEDLPAEVIQATVATEDRRFFNHFGLDLGGIARAAYHNLQNRTVTQGGSTISQQLVKNLYLTHDRTWQRKIKELFLTIQLEQTHSKNDILEKYLNTIYYGHAAYGIEAASRTYFGKPAADLTLAEAAMLAGLPRGPLYYSPLLDMDAARQRQSYVLEQMVGENYISEEEKETAMSEPVILKQSDDADEAAYFVDYLMNVELAPLWEEEPDLLQHGGLSIHTTLDSDMQLTAEKILEEIPVMRTDETGITQPQGALLAMDPASGYIRAMVGGKDYGETMFNRAFSLRSPGSAFKPFVYAAALEMGYTANSEFLCEPVSLTEEGMDTPYEPTDFGETFHHGHLTLREAIADSCNVTAVKLNQEMGSSFSIEMARRLGIESHIGDYFSLPLGTSEVTLMEMTAAFASFANSGHRVEPVIIKKVKNSAGEIILDNSDSEKRHVLDEGVAYLMTDMMKDVFSTEGTGHRAATILDRPAAGKTGTSHNTKDAYTVGYTPDLVAGIYVGDDQGIPLEGTGGQIAAPIWAEFITEALRDTPANDFRRPENIVEVTLCPLTGKKQGEQCGAAGVTEIYIAGTEPEEVCSYPECDATPSPYPWWQFWRH